MRISLDEALKSPVLNTPDIILGDSDNKQYNSIYDLPEKKSHNLKKLSNNNRSYLFMSKNINFGNYLNEEHEADINIIKSSSQDCSPDRNNSIKTSNTIDSKEFKMKKLKASRAIRNDTRKKSSFYQTIN